MVEARAGRDLVGRWKMNRDWRDDSGSAIVEFVVISLLLLIPVVYLVLCIARVQAGAFAAEAASYDAARAAVVEGVAKRERGADVGEAMSAGHSRAVVVTQLAGAAWAFESEHLETTLTCLGACLDFGTQIVADVSVTVELPGLPGWMRDVVPLEVVISASSSAPVDGLAQ